MLLKDPHVGFDAAVAEVRRIVALGADWGQSHGTAGAGKPELTEDDFNKGKSKSYATSASAPGPSAG
jgi:hypothetical protein